MNNTKKLEFTIPGSKSLTHRALIIAALAEGQSRVAAPLMCEDTELTKEALVRMGAIIEPDGEDLCVKGTAGKIEAAGEINLNNSGTSMRLLTSVAALAEGETVLTGNERMRSRPIEELIRALQELGVRVSSFDGGGCPPVRVGGGGIPGGQTHVRAAKSSQYLSSLLLASPYADQDVTIQVVDRVSSWPYVELTLKMMQDFGARIQKKGKNWFQISSGAKYQGRDMVIEGDCSSACYFWAAAVATGREVITHNIKPFSTQPDYGFLDVLARMGASIRLGSNWVGVQGRGLHGIEVDMNSMPDQVPTLAILASMAQGKTLIKNVAHLKYKESNRLGDLALEMRKIGIKVIVREDGLEIFGSRMRPGEIDPHNDHRLAMCFAVASLVEPGIKITNPGCVVKSFPTFWQLFGRFGS